MTRRRLLTGTLLFVSAVMADNVKEDRLSGTIQRVDHDSSVITVDGGNFRRQVIYSAKTSIKYRKKPGTASELREGQRIVARGKFNEKQQLIASSLELHEGK